MILDSAVSSERFDSSYGPRSLGELRGRFAVLVYEGRHRYLENLDFKKAVSALAAEPGSKDQLAVIAVGDVSELKSISAGRALVRTTVHALERVTGLTIWLDWEGVLTRAPYDLTAGESNVMVLDPHGRVIVRECGVLSRRRIEELVEMLCTSINRHRES